MPLNDFQQELCTTSTWDFTDVRALSVNCTLKPSPAVSNTQGLIDISVAILEANGVAVDQIRAVDHELAPGVYPDMTVHGATRDDWPSLYDVSRLPTSSFSARRSGSARSRRSAQG